MEENSKLKRIIDLYIENGEDDIYFRDEMVKAFNNALPEEKEEGYKYLNQKLKEKNTDTKNEKFTKKIIIGLIIILIAIIIACFFIDENEKVKTNSTVNTTTRNTVTNTKINHYCEASSCLNEGTYVLNREGGKKEYYCYKHYKQMEEWVEMMFNNTR